MAYCCIAIEVALTEKELEEEVVFKEMTEKAKIIPKMYPRKSK
ncbi:MAG: hypothetical protein P9M04_02935 [Candidatus Orphnella occulta]|nr:hypothetical protein [Candidatus Orphnella occulta]